MDASDKNCLLRTNTQELRKTVKLLTIETEKTNLDAGKVTRYFNETFSQLCNLSSLFNQAFPVSQEQQKQRGDLLNIFVDNYKKTNEKVACLGNPFFSSQEVRVSIFEWITSIDTYLRVVESTLSVGEPKFFRTLNFFIEKVGEKLELLESWSLATIYLTAFDIAINRIAKKHDYSPPNEEKNEERWKAKAAFVLKKLEEENKGLGQLEKALTSHLWNLRNKVVHNGYSPNENELELIRKIVTSIIDTL